MTYNSANCLAESALAAGVARGVGAIVEATETCEVERPDRDAGFEELMETMRGDLYWVRFFARPCCPAPDLEEAAGMLDRLKGEVEAREDFTAEQKAALAAEVESRKHWYATSGLCRGSRSL